MEFLEDNGIQYSHILIDELDLEIKKRAKKEFLSRFGQKMNYPTLVIGESDYQIGFIRVAWEKLFPVTPDGFETSDRALLRSNYEVRKFVDTSAAYKHWYINPDNKFRQDLEDGLLSNYKRYGFYHCPCRDTEAGKEVKRDVACRYAEDDIVEWGQCYCGLFVSKEFYEAKTELTSIPERRE